MQSTAEQLERQTVQTRKRHDRIREKAQAVLDVADAIERAQTRRDGVDWRLMGTNIQAPKGDTWTVMRHWYVGATGNSVKLDLVDMIFAGKMFERVNYWLREDGELVYTFERNGNFGPSHVVNLDALTATELRNIEAALNAWPT
jgi:hypothetical protein